MKETGFDIPESWRWLYEEGYKAATKHAAEVCAEYRRAIEAQPVASGNNHPLEYSEREKGRHLAAEQLETLITESLQRRKA